MERLTKIIESCFIDIYLGKIKDDSSNNFQLELRKRWLEKYTMDDLKELISKQPRPSRSNMDDPMSMTESISFIKSTYIPFLKSIKAQIGKERIEKHQTELEDIKKELAICSEADKENQIQNLKDGMKHFRGNEAEKKQRFEKSLQEINDRFEYTRLVPTVSIFQKRNVQLYEKVKELAHHFEDIYKDNKEQLFENEMHLIKISIKHVVQLVHFGLLDIAIPPRDEQLKRVDDILAILLL